MNRTLTLLFLLLLMWGCSEEEMLVEIPDSHFLEALIKAGVDENGDQHISQSEALACTSLNLPPSGIENLRGLEAFANLDSLRTGINPLGSIDLSGNPVLRYLDCSYCSLESLDLTHQLNLQELRCIHNQLEELDLSKHPGLIQMKCNNNLLQKLDLSANTELELMTSCGNILQSLDLSLHNKLLTIGIDNMPSLHTVYVWTLPFPPEGVRILMGYSPNVRFLTLN